MHVALDDEAILEELADVFPYATTGLETKNRTRVSQSDLASLIRVEPYPLPATLEH